MQNLMKLSLPKIDIGCLGPTSTVELNLLKLLCFTGLYIVHATFDNPSSIL